MTINSAKRLSAASKKLTAGVDKNSAYTMFKDAILSRDYMSDEFGHLSENYIVLGQKDLLLEFIIKVFNEYNVIQLVIDTVHYNGLSKVDMSALIKLADLYEARGNDYDCILNNTLIAIDIDDNNYIRNGLLSYLNKVCF